MKSFKIGITGVKGYLGAHLYQYLINNDKSNQIIPFDPRVDSVPAKLDIIYHLGSGSPKQYRNDPQAVKRIDVKTANIIGEYCCFNKTKLIFCSSASVYNPSKNLISENNHAKPSSNYGKSKLETEKILKEYSKSNFNLIIFRLFNLYGPNQSESFLIPQVINAITKKKHLIIKSPNSIRDFIYIDDCLHILSKSKEIFNRSILLNMGTGKGINVSMVVDKIKKELKARNSSTIIFNNQKGDYLDSYVADGTRLKKHIEKFSFVNFEDGLLKIINRL